MGAAGFDVAALQFRLAWRGFPSGPIDGGYGARTAAAVRRFQRWAGLGADGVAGRATIRALRGPIRRSPLFLSRPVAGPISDRFRPRGNRFHTGLDFPVPYGRTVRAARAGTVIGAGYDSGGYGNVVHIAHGSGVTTFYAHLSRITVRRGEAASAGERVGHGRLDGLLQRPAPPFRGAPARGDAGSADRPALTARARSVGTSTGSWPHSPSN